MTVPISHRHRSQKEDRNLPLQEARRPQNGRQNVRRDDDGCVRVHGAYAVFSSGEARQADPLVRDIRERRKGEARKNPKEHLGNGRKTLLRPRPRAMSPLRRCYGSLCGVCVGRGA